MGTIDPVFVLPEEHRPGQDTIEGDIPVIDFSKLDQDRASVVTEINKAAQEWGFFLITNHGVPHSLLDDVEKSAKQFFGLPREEKREVVRTAANPFGYFDTELTKNVRDWKEVFDFLTGERVVFLEEKYFENQWPSRPPEFREVCKKYAKAVEELAFTVLELICESLGQSAKALHGHFKASSTRIRLNYYPKCPSPDLVLGVSRHKDGCALTVLAQDEVGGLQVRQKDGEWVGVKALRDAFGVNVGDLIQVWSNDKYKSVEHRVAVNASKDRFSCPMFFGPSYDTNVAPFTGLVDDEHPAKYRPVNWGEYYKMRRDSNFENLGKPNVQIDNWAL